jgi:two-component system chemotaxis response regulator CheY
VSHTVLVCDDAIFMRTMISDILTQAGFEIVGEAESGSQAVQKYQALRLWGKPSPDRRRCRNTRR